jgi:hypothetical protein
MRLSLAVLLASATMLTSARRLVRSRPLAFLPRVLSTSTSAQHDHVAKRPWVNPPKRAVAEAGGVPYGESGAPDAPAVGDYRTIMSQVGDDDGDLERRVVAVGVMMPLYHRHHHALALSIPTIIISLLLLLLHSSSSSSSSSSSLPSSSRL